MKPIVTHAKNRIFLLEFTIVLFFLTLACTILLQIFAHSYQNRTKAREWNHIQEYVLSAGEILEGTSGTTEEFLSFFPNATVCDFGLILSFDSDWNPVSEEKAFYSMHMEISPKKKLRLTFYKQEELLYETTLAFPVFSSEIQPSIRRDS